MALTRAAVDAVLCRRQTLAITACKLSADPLNDASPVAYLSDAIGYALRQSGYTSADPTQPADADLAIVADGDLDRLFDVAEARLLETCLGNFNQVTWQAAGGDQQDLNAFRADLIKQLAAKQAANKAQYNQGLAALVSAAIDLGFEAQCADDPDETLI